MKPETEYIARQLAVLVLDDRDVERGRLDAAGSGYVEVHLRGIERNIRQQILVDHVSLAGKIADEIERQCAALNLEQLVAKTVADEVARFSKLIERQARSLLREAVANAALEAM